MNWQNLHLLTPVVMLPALGALVVAMLPSRAKGVIRGTAFFWTMGVFLFSLLLWAGFDPASAGFQFEEKAAWIPQLGIYYHLGIDGISLFLVLLTTFLTPLVILSAFSAVEVRVKEYMVHMLIIETGMLGALVSLDVFMFYIFWEIMLIPMYFLIGIWGGNRRIYATLKFVLFTVVGSLLMLVALIYLYYTHYKLFGTYSTDLPDIMKVVPSLTLKEQLWLFAAFGLAFAIKVPMFPFHTWLPDAHTEAPTGGSVILAGVLLKMGTYGFLRFAIPLFPLATHVLLPLIAALAVIGIIYGALVCMVQPDMKRLIAYSSISHLGFVMLGIAGMSSAAIQGAVYQMLNHGVSTGALFLLIGVIYERKHTRMIADMGGLAKIMPAYAALFLITALSSIGLPGLNGFVGEFLIMMGSFTSPNLPFGKWFVVAAATGVIFAAVYLLWMYRRVFFGPAVHEENKELKDLSVREWGYLLPLIALMFIMGIMPGTFLKGMRTSVDGIVVSYSKAVAEAGDLPSLLPLARSGHKGRFERVSQNGKHDSRPNVMAAPKFELLQGSHDKPKAIKRVISIPTSGGRKTVPLDSVHFMLPKDHNKKFVPSGAPVLEHKGLQKQSDR